MGVYRYFSAFALAAGILVGGYANSIEKFAVGFFAPAVNGRSNVYEPETGAIVYDQSDSSFWGYNHASQWVSLGGSSAGGLPPGVIHPYAGGTVPTGYLLCDGSAISRTTYSALFAAIGTAFGEGNGSTTFNLPDFRGRFLRGADGAAGRDPDKESRTAMNIGGATGNNIGSVQDDATQKNGLLLSDPGHGHNLLKDGNPLSNITLDGTGNTANYNAIVNGGAGSYGSLAVQNSSSGVTLGNGDNETRPTNAYVNYIIKY